MASVNTPPSPVIQTINQEQPQVNTTVDAPVFGGPIGNPIAAEVYGQPLSYRDFVHDQQNSLNQLNGGSVSRGLDHAGWYSIDGQPPSVGAIRPAVVSQPSGGNPYTGGQPPSLNDMGRRETSQTAGMSTDGEATEAYEFAGMSLTGKNFRMFHPDAFNKDGKM